VVCCYSSPQKCTKCKSNSITHAKVYVCENPQCQCRADRDTQACGNLWLRLVDLYKLDQAMKFLIMSVVQRLPQLLLLLQVLQLLPVWLLVLLVAGADFHMDSIFDDKDDDCTVDQTVASGPVLSSKRVPSFHDDGGASTKAAKVAKAAVSPLDLK